METVQLTGARMLTVLPPGIETMPPGTRSYFEALERYQAPFVQERLGIEGKLTAPGEYEEAFTEFKKFVALARLTRKPIAMTSESIDEVWHQFILFTKDYHAFCEEFYGSYFHHNPNVPSRPGRMNVAQQELHNLTTAYRTLYGSMPAVWSIR